MTQWTLSASAPALLIALLVTAAPAVALTDTVKDTVDALPSARHAPREAEAVADACKAGPSTGCTREVDARADAWTSPARAWVYAFRADPVGVLTAGVTGLGDELEDVSDTFTTWLGGKLDEHGLPNPFGGGP